MKPSTVDGGAAALSVMRKACQEGCPFPFVINRLHDAGNGRL